MISFKEWLKTMDYHAFIKSREGRFVNDVLQDDDFPLSSEKYIIYRYLSRLDDTQLSIFEKLYNNYIKFISRRFCDDDPEYDSIYL